MAFNAVLDFLRERFSAVMAVLSLSRAWLWRNLLALSACALVGRIGLALAGQASALPLTWFACGIALALLLRLGNAVWPGIVVGIGLAACATGAPLVIAALVAAGSTLGSLLGATLMRRRGLHCALDRPRDLALVGVFGLGLAMALNAANAAFWLAVGGVIGWVDVPPAAAHGWLGDALGAVVLGAPLLTATPTAWRRAFGAAQWPSTAVLLIATPVSAALATALGAAGDPLSSPLFFLPHVVLAVLAWRSGVFVASATALMLGVVMALVTLQGATPSDPAVNAAAVAGYVASLFALPLLIGALRDAPSAQERRSQLALDIAQIGIGDWDVAADRILLSPRWLTLLDRVSPGGAETGASFLSLIHTDDLAAVTQTLSALRSGDAANGRIECRMRSEAGGWRLLALSAQVTEQAIDQSVRHILLTARDIGELQAARARHDLTQSVFQHLHEGLLITDPQHRVLEVNPTFLRLTGYTREELIGRVPAMLQPRAGDDASAAQHQAMQDGLAATGSWRGEFRQRRANGSGTLLQLAISAVRSGSGAVLNHVLAITDITHAREQLEQLERQAHFDELTRLPNRVRLAQMLQSAMQTSRREASLLTVCYLDLDHFKPVNDRFGHEAGDRLLIELANRMRRSLRSWAGGDDVVARIGGDEFVLLLRTATIEESRHAVERVLMQISQPYGLGAAIGPVRVTASIGATVFPLDSADAETLLRHADHAMYGAKQAGRNGYLFFDAEHDKRAEARFVALGRVQEALDNEEFRLHFQPKVDMRTSKVLGVEALLRWQHPEEGMISPAQFLPLIENTGLSISVGNWVMQRGIEQLGIWLRAGLDMTVSINVSARHLQEPLFAQHLSSLLALQQPPVAQRLIIEVLETAALADIDYTCALMEECRALGVRFALDDFGTGYSTFTYLKRLPIDMLKIDRSFVINMLGDREDLAIVEGVIGLSQTFGCAVVAEGVETPAQAQRLIEIGCSVGQGNGIAAAMPAESVVAWVQNYKGMPAAQDMLPV